MPMWAQTLLIGNVDDDTRWLTPHPNRGVPPPSPCLTRSPCTAHGLRLSPHCLRVCCHWLLGSVTLLRFLAYDLCHASFLRPFTAISLTAFSVWGSGFLVGVHVLICRVYRWVFVVSHWPLGLRVRQGDGGATPRLGWGGSNRVSSSRAAGLYFGVVVVFVCFTRVSTFGACFLIFGWVLFVPVLHQKHVLPLGCIFSTDFLAPSFSQCVFFGLVF